MVYFFCLFVLRLVLLEEWYPPHNSAWPGSLPLWVKPRRASLCAPSDSCCGCAALFIPQHLPQEANVPHLPSGFEGFLPSRRAQLSPSALSASRAGTQRHGVVSASNLSRKLINVGVGGSTLKRNLSCSTEGVTLTIAALGGKQPY